MGGLGLGLGGLGLGARGLGASCDSSMFVLRCDTFLAMENTEPNIDPPKVWRTVVTRMYIHSFLVTCEDEEMAAQASTLIAKELTVEDFELVKEDALFNTYTPDPEDLESIHTFNNPKCET